jgi:hypothetical protein
MVHLEGIMLSKLSISVVARLLYTEKTHSSARVETVSLSKETAPF